MSGPGGKAGGGKARGRRGDLTSGPILPTLIAFSVSTLLSSLLQTFNQSISLIWIGRLLGESALAATTNGNTVMSLLFTVLTGFSMATMIRIGFHFGAGNERAARRTFGCGIGWALGVSMVLAAAGVVFTPRLLHLLGTPPAAHDQAVHYLRVLFLTLPLTGLSSTVAMASRGAGDSRSSLYGTVVTLVTSVVLNPLLILGAGPLPRFGLPGAALASGLANLAGICVMGVVIWRPGAPLRIPAYALRWFLPSRTELAYLLRNGMPISLHLLLAVGAQLVMIGLVNREGLNFTAAFGVSMQIWNYMQSPSFAISAGLTAMASQAIGAGDHARVGEITRTGMMVNTSVAAVLAMTILVLIRPILALFFGHGSPAIPIGVHMQSICIWGFVLSGLMSAMTAVLRAYGVQLANVAVNLVSVYFARLAFYFLTYPLLGADALWWSFLFGTAVSVVLIRIVFVRGGWTRLGDEARQPASITAG
ncbi:MATE family efflux transporter [Novosphingobium bradum]|uniref:MATE family efflux transporter n=1 Tax=Novosphingobium bradum TaxID=1737444 RepID=A0ABV7IQN0_9SPHN